MPTLRFVVIILLFTLMAGFYIVPTRAMPDNAVLLLNDEVKTYFSPKCAQNEKKMLRPGTAAEARRLKYAPDDRCQGEAGFCQEGRSLTGSLLVRLGLLPPLPSRWNHDGTWNW